MQQWEGNKMKLFKTLLSIVIISLGSSIFAASTTSQTYLASLQKSPIASKVISTCDNSAKNALNNYKVLYPNANTNTLKSIYNTYVNQCVYGQNTNTQNLSVPTIKQVKSIQKAPINIKTNIY